MRIALAIALCIGLLAEPAPGTRPSARAAGTEMNLCNHTSKRLDVANGYFSRGPGDADSGGILTGPFVSRGWLWVEPGECTTIENPFGARYMYWWAFGENAGKHYAGSGRDHFCIPNTWKPSPTFTFEEENESQAACTAGHVTGDGYPNLWIAANRVDLEVDPNVDVTDGD